MAKDTPTGNIALLIDADNVPHTALDPVLTVLAELGTVNIRRVYGNWSKAALKEWATKTMQYGIEPQQQFDVTKGKNATDMKMTIDAMDLLFSGKIDGFGIMSSDSDFMPLAMRIRQNGIPVYGFGEAKTPIGFRAACTRFIDLGALEQSADAEPIEAVAAAAAPAPNPSAPKPAPQPRKPIDPELIKLLIDAYKASKADEHGYVHLGHLGQLAANRSSFDARNYGYARLSDLLEDVPNFHTERREGQVFVKRLR
ncbi:MAG: hypothetical protein B7Y45_08405 [Sphingomonas sp. 28-66-16]|nr:MAG: hypothetical protein B7Y45_08405 [Sphingomonas sp. 28-66-16]